jgi:hypothetical protein
LISGIILVVAVVAFGTVSFVTVPVSSTWTATQVEPYMVPNVVTYTSIELTLNQTYATSRLSTVEFEEATTYSFLTSSTSLVPASQVLAPNGAFWIFAVLVIGALALVTVWIAVKSKRQTQNTPKPEPKPTSC